MSKGKINMRNLIPFTISKNEFLNRDIQAYYVYDYIKFRVKNNPDFLVHLKNTGIKTNKYLLNSAVEELYEIFDKISDDISSIENIDCVCVVPRSKARWSYSDDELLFMTTIKSMLPDDFDGTDWIERHTNTKTTHLSHSEYANYGGDGDMPYPGITKDTCYISSNVKGKNILLIDDIYTKTINVVEDCIPALLDKGAKNVVFLAIGRTVFKG